VADVCDRVMKVDRERSYEQPMSRAVFLVTTKAVAGPDSEDADGRRYPILAFAAGEGEADAERVALEDLANHGYLDIVIERTGEITDPTAIPEDLRRAYDTAQRWGCALIIYDAP
jgi:hypothetical protein